MNNLDEIIKEAMKKAKGKMKRVNILIAGKTGVGKSTLLNAVFDDNLATTGSGKPVTQNIKEYRKEESPISLFDTKGLEIQNYKSIITDLENYINSRNNDSNPENHIHIAWICLDENSRRIEDAEIELTKFLSEKIPVVAVITKAINDDGFRQKVKELLPNIKNAVRVNSVPFKIGEIDVPQSGLKDLVELSMELLPEAQRTAFAAAQKVDISQKVKSSHKIVASAALTAAGAAATPIPFSDVVTIVPIQVGMLAGISYAFGLKADKALLFTLVSSTITGGAGSLAGRAIVSNLIKLIPGIGSIAGGAISAAVAATITTLFGEAYIRTLEVLSKKGTINMSDVTEEFKKQLKLK